MKLNLCAIMVLLLCTQGARAEKAILECTSPDNAHRVQIVTDDESGGMPQLLVPNSLNENELEALGPEGITLEPGDSRLELRYKDPSQTDWTSAELATKCYVLKKTSHTLAINFWTPPYEAIWSRHADLEKN